MTKTYGVTSIVLRRGAVGLQISFKMCYVTLECPPNDYFVDTVRVRLQYNYLVGTFEVRL